MSIRAVRSVGTRLARPRFLVSEEPETPSTEETSFSHFDSGAFRGSYVAWGYFNVFLVVLWTLVPWRGVTLPAGVTTEIGNEVAFFSSVAHILVGGLVLRIPIRKSWGVALFTMLEVLLCFSTLYIATTMGRIDYLGMLNLWPLVFVVHYISISMLVYVWPRARVVIETFLLTYFTISAFIAFLQFAGLKSAFVVVPDVKYLLGNDYATGSVRAVGLAFFPQYAAVQAIVGAAILVGRLRVRPLLWWEVSLFLVMSAYAVVAQFRTMFPFVALLWGIAVFLTIRRSPKLAPLIVAALMLIILLPTVVLAKRFEYVLSGEKYTDSLRIRSTRSFSQIGKIFDAFPMTGIGNDSGLSLGFPDQFVGEDKWSHWFVDTTYGLLLCTEGLPGVITLFAAYAAICFGLYRLYRRDHVLPEQKARLLTAFLCALTFAGTSAVGNFVIFPNVRTYFIVAVALAAPSCFEVQEDLRRARLKLRARRQLPSVAQV